MTAYSISKYGVEAFSDALRREMRPWGVNVSIIEAGAHKTKLVSGDVLVNQWQSLWDGLNEELKEEYGQEGLQKGEMPCYEKNSPSSSATKCNVSFYTWCTPFFALFSELSFSSFAGLISLKSLDSVASPRTHKVVNSVVHALTSRNPRTRYVIGLDAKALVWLSMLPAGITDFLFRVMALSPEPRLKKNNRNEVTT